MGLKKLRLAQITSRVSNDRYPIYGAFLKLQDTSVSEEMNSVEVSITNVIKEKTLQADDKEKVHKTTVRADGVLKVYECMPSVARDMFGYAMDANGNTIERLNNRDKKHYGMFFEGKTAKDKKYQKYIYDVEFDEPNAVFTTDNGEESGTLEIPFRVEFVETDAGIVRSATVYEGNNGWVSGEPTAIYKGVEAVGGLIPLATPIVSVDQENAIITWLPVPNAFGYSVYLDGIVNSSYPNTVFEAEIPSGSEFMWVQASGDEVTYAGVSPYSNVVYVGDIGQ